ncbi:hypothetical protein AAFO90_17035 [Phaeobacter sp. CAU 1743]|uniref:hypothetical protein n=1 Tax=Phaeobacter sp. CAU 1743 TaxID=3140367 RepID=UPI00325BDF31
MAGFVDLTSSLGKKIRHDNLRLVGQIADYNPGIDGREQVLYAENRVWQGTIEFPPMFGRDLALLRSVPTRLHNRAGILRIPLLNVASLQRVFGGAHKFQQSVGVPQTAIDQGYTTFGDTTTFSDNTGYALPEMAHEYLSEDLVTGAMSVTLDSYIGRHLAIGDRFSIMNRLYEVGKNDDGRIRFSPPLRTAAPTGTLVRVSEPYIDLRLAGNADWDVFVNLGTYSNPLTVNVVEAFYR